jgi:hypothetical protein
MPATPVMLRRGQSSGLPRVELTVAQQRQLLFRLNAFFLLTECFFLVATMESWLFPPPPPPPVAPVPVPAAAAAPVADVAAGAAAGAAAAAPASAAPPIPPAVPLLRSSSSTMTSDSNSRSHHIDVISSNQQFASFIETFKEFLCAAINMNIRLLEGSLRALNSTSELSKYLNFSVKRKYLSRMIRRLKRPMLITKLPEDDPQRVALMAGRGQWGSPLDIAQEREEEEVEDLEMDLHRSNILRDSYEFLEPIGDRQLLRGKFNVQFDEEEGIDAGGLTREWLQLLTREVFKPDYGFFVRNADGVTYLPNATKIAGQVDMFRFVGRLLGKALCDGLLLDAHFSRSIYKHMLGVPVGVGDLEAVDPSYYRSLHMMLEMDQPLEDLGMELTFTVSTSEFGVERIEVSAVSKQAGGVF